MTGEGRAGKFSSRIVSPGLVKQGRHTKESFHAKGGWLLMEHGLAYDNGYASQRTGCRPFQMVGVLEQD